MLIIFLRIYYAACLIKGGRMKIGSSMARLTRAITAIRIFGTRLILPFQLIF
jgi:hypothetical protein